MWMVFKKTEENDFLEIFNNGIAYFKIIIRNEKLDEVSSKPQNHVSK